MIFGIILLLVLAGWFVFSLLGAIEEIVRSIQRGETEEELDYTSYGVQATLALALLSCFLVMGNS